MIIGKKIKYFTDSEFLHLGHRAVISDSSHKWKKTQTKPNKKPTPHLSSMAS